MKKVLKVMFCLLVLAGGTVNPVLADKPSMVLLTLPFGTPSYMLDSSLESFFGELGEKSPVSLKLKQTPGAMYMVKALLKNEASAHQGKKPYQLVQAWAPVVAYMQEGRWPFEKMPMPNVVALSGGVFMINTFVTFDPEIKTPENLAGKKVGFAEKARVFQSILPNKAYFDKAYGGFDKVKWQYLGANNAKDALLNGSIDAVWTAMSGKVSLSDTGELVCTMAVPSPPLLELMSAGKQLYFLPENADLIRKVYDPKTDFVMQPVRIKKGAIKGVDKEFTARGMVTVMAAWNHLSEDVVADFVTTVYTNLDRLKEYNKAFSLYPRNPYPLGVEKKLVHPGLLKAMEKMGMEIPKIGR